MSQLVIKAHPYGRTSRVWDPLLAMKSVCAEVVGWRPGRGNTKESFSSYQETGKVFSPEISYSKFQPRRKNYAYSGKVLLLLLYDDHRISEKK